MMTDLKPCPFCGAQPEVPDVGDYFVECPSCGVQGPISNKDGQPHAKEEWNRRAIEAEVMAEAQEPVANNYWRDVSDELPKEAQEVLFVRDGKTKHGAWIGGIFWNSNEKMVAAKWMPMPSPEIAAPQPPAPCPKCDELHCELVVQKGMLKISRAERDEYLTKCEEQRQTVNWISRERGALQAKVAELESCNENGIKASLLAAQLYESKVAEQSAEIERLKTVPMEYRRMAFNAQLQEENAKQAERIAELEQQRRQWLDTDLCGMVVRDQERTITKQAALIEKCEKALINHRDLTRPIHETGEAIAAIAAQKAGAKP